MKAPSWLVMEYRGVDPNKAALLYEVRVRRWHPGFWWAFIRQAPGIIRRERRVWRVARAIYRNRRDA